MIEKMLARTNTLEKALDASWLRNEVISQNIANVDTPNYKRKSVKFEELLSGAANARKGTNRGGKYMPVDGDDVDSVEIQITEDNKSLSMRLDGNNVDVENEMALMAKNSIKYNTIVQRLSGKFKSLQSVISEGRK